MDTFSAQTSVYRIMLEYLQPFELAVATDTHTHETYINAAINGSVEYMTKYPYICTNFNEALYCAARHGQLEAITICINRGAIFISAALNIAAKYGQYWAIALLIQHGAKYFNTALVEAAAHGQLRAIDLLVTCGAHDVNGAFLHAAVQNQTEALKLLYTHGARNIRSALRAAVHAELENSIRTLLEMDAIDVDYMLNEAAAFGYCSVITLLISLGAKHVYTAYTKALSENQPDAAALLQTYLK